MGLAAKEEEVRWLQVELDDVNTSMGRLNDKYVASNQRIVDFERELEELRGELSRKCSKLKRLIEAHQELQPKVD